MVLLYIRLSLCREIGLHSRSHGLKEIKVSKRSFFFADENGKDQGINVRQKVKEMVEFVQDDDRLREERKKAKKNRDKYIGVSSDSMGDFRYGESCFQK